MCFAKRTETRIISDVPSLRARKKADIKDFRFHELRHTAASYLVMKGIDLNTVREILGHKSLEMALRYSQLSPEHKTRAVSVLDGDMDTIRSPKAQVVEVPSAIESRNSLASCQLRNMWRGGRVVECGGLENRYPRKGIIGSNPILSVLRFATNDAAIIFYKKRK